MSSKLFYKVSFIYVKTNPYFWSRSYGKQPFLWPLLGKKLIPLCSLLKFRTHLAFSSPEPTILLACSRNRELWEQPFQACAIDEDCVKPDGQNRPFPSSLVSLFQNESNCETFHMKMSPACSFILMQISHFHKNGFALRLALKQRRKGSRKWPIRLFPLLFQNCGSQSSRFLPQARRIVGCGDENGDLGIGEIRR